MFYTVNQGSSIVARLRTKSACEAYVSRMASERGLIGLIISNSAVSIPYKHNEWCQH